jgi:hypothetical protein
MHHLIFLADGPIDAFHEGSKHFEFRLSTFWAPFMRVERGHKALLKRTGGDVELVAVVGAVDKFDRSTPEGLERFLRRWSGGPQDEYFATKPTARYGAAIELLKMRRATFPADRTPRRIRRGWVADFDVGDWRF